MYIRLQKKVKQNTWLQIFNISVFHIFKLGRKEGDREPTWNTNNLKYYNNKKMDWDNTPSVHFHFRRETFVHGFIVSQDTLKYEILFIILFVLLQMHLRQTNWDTSIPCNAMNAKRGRNKYEAKLGFLQPAILSALSSQINVKCIRNVLHTKWNKGLWNLKSWYL